MSRVETNVLRLAIKICWWNTFSPLLHLWIIIKWIWKTDQFFWRHNTWKYSRDKPFAGRTVAKMIYNRQHYSCRAESERKTSNELRKHLPSALNKKLSTFSLSNQTTDHKAMTLNVCYLLFHDKMFHISYAFNYVASGNFFSFWVVWLVTNYIWVGVLFFRSFIVESRYQKFFQSIINKKIHIK